MWNGEFFAEQEWRHYLEQRDRPYVPYDLEAGGKNFGANEKIYEYTPMGDHEWLIHQLFQSARDEKERKQESLKKEEKKKKKKKERINKITRNRIEKRKKSKKMRKAAAKYDI